MTRSRLTDLLIDFLVPPAATLAVFLIFCSYPFIKLYIVLEKWADEVYKP